MAWADRLSDPSLRIYGYLTIKGTPWVFSSQTLPSGWVASPYTEVVALDLPDPLAIPQSPLERKAGVAQPGGLALTLGPRLWAQLSYLLSPVAPTRTRLTEDLLYSADTSYTDKIYCDTSALGLGVGDIAYIGHEAISVDGVDAAYYDIDDREELGSVEGQWRISQGAPWVSTKPQGLIGRHATLTLGLADAAGVPIDAAFGGDNQWEAWRGEIDEVQEGKDHRTWTLQLLGLEASIGKEIAGDLTSRTGRLHIAGSAEGGVNPGMQPYEAYSGVWLSPSLRYLKCAAADAGTAGALTDITVDLLPGGIPYFVPNLMSLIAERLEVALLSAPFTSTWHVYYDDKAALSGADQEADDDPAVLDKRHSILIDSNSAGTVDFRWYHAGAAGETYAAAAGSILSVMGFNVDDLTTPAGTYSSPSITLGQVYRASNFPLAYYLPPDATEIEATWEDEIPPPSADGYFVVTSTGEVVKYGSWSYRLEGTGDSNGLITFEDCLRGQIGTNASAVAVSWESSTSSVWGTVEKTTGGWTVDPLSPFGFVDTTETTTVGTWMDKATVSVGGSPEIQIVAGFDGSTLVEILLSLVSATGTATTRGAYDLAGIPADCGAAQSLDDWDVDRMLAVEAELPAWATTRYMIVSQDVDLSSWIAEELISLGMVLQARTLADRTYRLTLDRVTDPAVVTATTLTTADLSAADNVEIREYGRGSIVNRIKAKALWNVVGEDWVGPEWIFEDRQSQQDHGKEPAMELSMRGLMLSLGGALGNLSGIVLGILSHWSRPYRVVTLHTRRSTWTLRPGDCISLTHADLPATAGGYGWTAEPLVVLAVEPSYLSSSLRPSSVITALHLPDRRCTYYAPSARVETYNSGVPSIVVYANEYSSADLPYPLDPSVACSDIRWFEGAKSSTIRIHNEGDDASAITRTVVDVDVDTRTIVLNSTLAPLVPGTRCVITWPGYDSANTYQQGFAYLADSAYTLGAAGDPAYQYGG